MTSANKFRVICICIFLLFLQRICVRPTRVKIKEVVIVYQLENSIALVCLAILEILAQQHQVEIEHFWIIMLLRLLSFCHYYCCCYFAFTMLSLLWSVASRGEVTNPVVCVKGLLHGLFGIVFTGRMKYREINKFVQTSSLLRYLDMWLWKSYSHNFRESFHILTTRVASHLTISRGHSSRSTLVETFLRGSTTKFFFLLFSFTLKSILLNSLLLLWLFCF